jgi:hypothetical protein
MVGPLTGIHSMRSASQAVAFWGALSSSIRPDGNLPAARAG